MTSKPERKGFAHSEHKKPVLYCFGSSIWSAAAELAVEELDLREMIEREPVNLMKGENFNLKFVSKSAEIQSTIPALITPDGTLYGSTIDVVRYLISIAPANTKFGEAGPSNILELVHADDVDPNFFKTAARNEKELDKKISDGRKEFIHNRQEVLKNVGPTAPDHLKDFYKNKLEANTDLESIFQGTASKDALDAFYQKSQRNWDAVGNFITNVLPRYIPDNGFIGGSAPGEADFHIAAYLARIVTVLGGNSELGGASCFKVFGDVPKSVNKYWDTWVVRESWRTVYKEGIH